MKILLRNGKHVLIDKDDWNLINFTGWYATTSDTQSTQYAMSTCEPRVMMHNVIMGQRGIDHINGDGLDNRRCNLRIVTSSLNGANRKKQIKPATSRYKGVTFHKNRNRPRQWLARLDCQGQIFLRWCLTEQEAANEYNYLAKEIFGKYARLNSV